MDSYRSEEVNNIDFEKCKEISHTVQKNVEEILPKLKKIKKMENGYSLPICNILDFFDNPTLLKNYSNKMIIYLFWNARENK